MFVTSFKRFALRGSLSIGVLLSAIAAHAEETPATVPVQSSQLPTDQMQNQIAELRMLLNKQQQELDGLRKTIELQNKALDRLLAGIPNQAPAAAGVTAASTQPARAFAASGPEVASLTPVVPVAAAAASAATPVFEPNTGDATAAQAYVKEQSPAEKLDTVSKTVETLHKGLGGFRFSGDFRYRLDMQLRSANEVAGPLQNIRGRYRVRVNIDKDLAAGLSTHLQLSTGPLNVDTTNDQDFAAFGVKHPLSIAEAWMRYQNKGLAVRGGRMEEVFADNSRFLWDDDIRFNGFDLRYNFKLGGVFTGLEFRTGAYILSNPNTPIVPAGSPYLAAGYRVGQKVRDSALFHPGLILRGKLGKGWTHQLYATYSHYRNADEIQLASTAAGFPGLISNPVGIGLSGALSAGGNATTTAGGALFAARHYEITHFGWRVDYPEAKLGTRNFPFFFDIQDSINVGTGKDRNAFMATASLGAARKLGEVRFLYQFSRKEANSIISQFTDDDLGTGTGVNTTVNAIRVDVGLTRYLQWQNLLFIQNPIAANRPGFFVLLPKGVNTTYRFLGQLAFTF